jgi:hypothetical protein
VDKRHWTKYVSPVVASFLDWAGFKLTYDLQYHRRAIKLALHVATEQRKTNAIRLLTTLAQTGMQDANGDTALELAQKRNKTGMVRLLRDLEDRS